MRSLLAVVLALAACGGESGRARRAEVGPRPGEALAPGGAPTVAATAEAAVAPAPPQATVEGRRRGTPHFGTITGVVLDADGTMAVSRDALGGVRVWPALDGSREPQALPVAAPAALAIARRDDGSLVAVIDGNGVSTLLRLDADGLVLGAASLAPDVPLAGVVALPGGTRVLAVRSDQHLLLLDDRGAELARLAARGARVLAVHATAAGDAAFALLRRGGEAPTFEVRKLALAGDRLAWDGAAHPLPLPPARLPHTVSAVSPDGALLAWVATDASQRTLVQMMRLADGAAIAIDGDVVPSAPATTLGAFTAPGRFELGGQGGNAWRVEVDGATAAGYSEALPGGTTPPAFATGVVAAGYHGHLVVRRGGEVARYVGYDDLSPSSGALAADGQSAAWITTTGAVVVQRFDGRADVRIKGPTDWFGSAAIVDDRHVLAARNDGAIVLFDSVTGQERAALHVATSTPWFQWNPTTRRLAVMHDAGVVWVLEVDPAAAAPLGAPVAIGDGAQSFALLDPAATGAVLVTIDAAQTRRRYTAAELARGVTAKEMRDREPVGAAAWFYDRAGIAYVQAADGVELRDGDRVVRKLAIGATSLVAAAPTGDRLAIVDATLAVKVFATDGAALWSVAGARAFPSVTWSEDGRRVVVATPGSAAVLDAATGARVVIAAGWAFGATTRVPQAFPTNQAPSFTP